MAGTPRVVPARVRLLDTDLSCTRPRTYGHRAACPECDWQKVYRSPRDAAAGLNDHRLTEHGSSD